MLVQGGSRGFGFYHHIPNLVYHCIKGTAQVPQLILGGGVDLVGQIAFGDDGDRILQSSNAAAEIKNNNNGNHCAQYNRQQGIQPHGEGALIQCFPGDGFG
ncbi:hypothetical protein D3C75_831150 [compost metagenome]